MVSAEPVNASRPSCPSCKSSKIWRDGLRYTLFGDKIQRWLCRDCGYRFSEKPSQENPEWSINTPVALHYRSQICATLKDAKNLEPQTEIKTVAGESSQLDNKGKIVEFSFWMLKQGYSQATIEGRVKLLKRMLRLGANFNDEESIKEIIANQQWAVSRKVNAVDAYNSLLKMQGKTWTPPIYRRVRKLPFIPTESEIDQLIAGTSKRISTISNCSKKQA
jgi:hypothetical protein